MKTLEIIEGLNKWYEEKYPNKGYFIHKLTNTSNTISKAYKTYNLEVWYKFGNKKELFLSLEKTCRCVSESDVSTILKGLNIEISKLLFKNFNKIKEYGVQ